MTARKAPEVVYGFEREGREVVLLTLREAEAILAAMPIYKDGDLGRALRVLRHQIGWLHERGATD